jgi:hypothetical protein
MATPEIEKGGGCPAPSQNVATYIDAQIDRFADAAREFVDNARDALAELLQYRGQLTPYNLPGDLPDGSPGQCTVDMPEEPNYDGFDIQPPLEPSPGTYQDVDVGRLAGLTVPDFDIADPTYTVPSAPVLAEIGAPPSAPSLLERVMPEYTGMDLPPVPTFEELQIPELPEIDISSLSVARPDFESNLPYIYDNNFTSDAQQLQLAVWNALQAGDTDGGAVRARWNEMLLGGTGLPIEVEQALFDRGISREEVSSAQAIHTAQTEWAARGFTLPGSTVLARVSEARRANRDARATLNREILIQVHTQEIENLRFAVQQGVALEQQYMQRFSMTHDVALKTVENSYRIAQAVADLRLAYIKILVDVYQADIMAFKEKVQVELAKLEAFKAQLEGEKIRGELNLQRVELYKGQLQGVMTHVEIFKAQVEGVSAQIRGDLAQVEMYRGKLDGYKTNLESQRLQVDVYTARLQGEKTKADQYMAQVQSFSERVRAFSTTVDASSKAVAAEVSVRESQLQEYKSNVDIWRQKYEVQIAQMNAGLTQFKAEIEQFSAMVSARVENAKLCSQRDSLRLDSAKLVTDQATTQVKNLTDIARANADLELEAMKATAQTASQLAASAMSALSIGASISQSGSDSRSCSYGESLGVSLSI